jgi:hypothetical protein
MTDYWIDRDTLRSGLIDSLAQRLVFSYCFTIGPSDGLPESGVTIHGQMTAGPGTDGYALDTEMITLVSDAYGIAQHTGFVCGASYKFRRGTSAWWTDVQVAPYAATWNLGEILGTP